MNLKRIKTSAAAGILAASMLLPNMTAFAAVSTFGKDATDVITKKVTADDGVTFTNESFTYTFEQREANVQDSGVTANQETVTIPSITIDSASSGEAYTTDENGNKVYTFTKGGIDLTNIEKAGVYTFTVKETARDTSGDPAGTTWVYDESQYILRVYAKNDGNGGLNYEMTLRKLNEDGTEPADGDKLTTAEFNNTLTKTAAFLRIAKLVDNDEFADENTDYTFEVTFDEGKLNTASADGYAYTITDGSHTYDSGTIKSGETITMKKNQYAEFKTIPAGTTVTVKEINLASNINTVTVTEYVGQTEVKDAKLTHDEDNNTYVTDSILVDEAGTSITFTNTWKDVTITGVVTNIAPYVTLVVVATAAIAAYVVLKRRIAR